MTGLPNHAPWNAPDAEPTREARITAQINSGDRCSVCLSEPVLLELEFDHEAEDPIAGYSAGVGGDCLAEMNRKARFAEAHHRCDPYFHSEVCLAPQHPPDGQGGSDARRSLMAETS